MKKTLGRGLQALIDDGIIEQDRIISIPLEDIKPSEHQSRVVFEEEKIEELARSIEENGLISPIIVKEEGEGYRLIAGERRYLAVKLLGREEIEAIVKNVKELEAAKMTLIENIQREDLNPIEEARGYRLLMDNYNLTQNDIASSIGKSRSHIANLLRLLNLPEETIEYLSDGSLSLGHGKILAGLNDDSRINQFARLCKSKGLTVKELNKEIEDLKPRKPKPQRSNIYMDDQIKTLEEYFGTKVDYTGSEQRGKLLIEYYSNEDLQRIIQMITEG